MKNKKEVEAQVVSMETTSIDHYDSHSGVTFSIVGCNDKYVIAFGDERVSIKEFESEHDAKGYIEGSQFPPYDLFCGIAYVMNKNSKL